MLDGHQDIDAGMGGRRVWKSMNERRGQERDAEDEADRRKIAGGSKQEEEACL